MLAVKLLQFYFLTSVTCNLIQINEDVGYGFQKNTIHESYHCTTNEFIVLLFILGHYMSNHCHTISRSFNNSKLSAVHRVYCQHEVDAKPLTVTAEHQLSDCCPLT